MKPLFKKAIFLNFQIIIASFITPLFSQTDTSRVSYCQEIVDSSDYNNYRKIRYLDINLKDETRLFKIGIPTFNVNFINSSPTEKIGLFFAFEKKINPSWSFIVQNDNNFNNTRISGITKPFSSDLDYGIRYYFFIQRKIKEGISGNNCNGAYAGFFLMNLNQFEYQQINLSYGNFYNINVNYYNFYHLINKSPTFNLNLGVQKRLNNFSFIDANIFVQYTPKGTVEQEGVIEYTGYNFKVVTYHNPINGYFNFGLDFKIGLAWGMK